MDDRNEVRNPLDAVIGRAVSLSTGGQSIHSSAPSSSFDGSTPASVATTQGEDGGTRYPFFWGLDSWGSTEAVWTESE